MVLALRGQLTCLKRIHHAVDESHNRHRGRQTRSVRSGRVCWRGQEVRRYQRMQKMDESRT